MTVPDPTASSSTSSIVAEWRELAERLDKLITDLTPAVGQHSDAPQDVVVEPPHPAHLFDRLGRRWMSDAHGGWRLDEADPSTPWWVVRVWAPLTADTHHTDTATDTETETRGASESTSVEDDAECKSQLSVTIARMLALANWHDAEARKARHRSGYPGESLSANSEAWVHEDAARRIREGLITGPLPAGGGCAR